MKNGAVRSPRKASTPIGRRLREERLKTGLSQQALGEAIGLEAGGAGVRINQYETGVHTPNFGTVKRLAGYLGVDTALFYAESDAMAEHIRGYR